MHKIFRIVFFVALLPAGFLKSQTITIDRDNEIMIKLEDSGDDYTGYWTMNDGLGNMAIKLGTDGDGKHIVTNDGAAEILWGAHGIDGYISLNASQQGTAGNSVTYSISLILDSEDNAVFVGNPNNSTGGTNSIGHKIADQNGVLYTHNLSARDASGLDVNLGSSGGDLTIYDGNGTPHYIGDQLSGEADGIVLRTYANPASGEPIFVVESSGYSQRLRVEHSGALKTSNYLEVDGTGDSYVAGPMAINSTSVQSGYALTVDGKILAEEVKVQTVPSSDYVFDPEYNLRPIEEVEKFISENKHLPDIPSAKEFKENGVGLGEMDNMLLMKVEELTLYMIEIQKQMDQLKVENDQLRQMIGE